jgi:hypothetical protein
MKENGALLVEKPEPEKGLQAEMIGHEVIWASKALSPLEQYGGACEKVATILSPTALTWKNHSQISSSCSPHHGKVVAKLPAE